MDPTQLDLCQSRFEGISHFFGMIGWLVLIHSRRDDFSDVERSRQELLDPREQSDGRDTGTAVIKHM